MWKWFNPCEPCCTSCRIGFEQWVWSNVYQCLCTDNHKFVTGVVSDISKLSQCDFVFAGCDNCCVGTSFTSGQYPQLKTWVENGGRLWVAGEYDGCMWPYGWTATNELLAGIGSSITLRKGMVDCGCAGGDPYGPWIMQPGDAGIAQGIDITYACTGFVDGGTSVGLRRDEPDQILALEQLGDGIVMVCCDSNIIGSGMCGQNCDLLERWYSWATEEIV